MSGGPSPSSLVEVRLALLQLTDRRVAGDRREPQVEQRVERRPVRGPLEDGGGVGGPQVLAVEQVDHAERTGRVEHLGQRDAQAGVAQRVAEADLALEQPAGRHVS